jgi:hypothetical protein
LILSVGLGENLQFMPFLIICTSEYKTQLFAFDDFDGFFSMLKQLVDVIEKIALPTLAILKHVNGVKFILPAEQNHYKKFVQLYVINNVNGNLDIVFMTCNTLNQILKMKNEIMVMFKKLNLCAKTSNQFLNAINLDTAKYLSASCNSCNYPNYDENHTCVNIEKFKDRFDSLIYTYLDNARSINNPNEVLFNQIVEELKNNNILFIIKKCNEMKSQH